MIIRKFFIFLLCVILMIALIGCGKTKEHELPIELRDIIDNYWNHAYEIPFYVSFWGRSQPGTLINDIEFSILTEQKDVPRFRIWSLYAEGCEFNFYELFCDLYFVHRTTLIITMTTVRNKWFHGISLLVDENNLQVVLNGQLGGFDVVQTTIFVIDFLNVDFNSFDNVYIDFSQFVNPNFGTYCSIWNL